MHRAAAFLALLAMVGCHSKSGDSAQRGASAPANVPIPPREETSVVPGALPDAGALVSIADSNNALGLDIYEAVRRGHRNVALSPLSVSMALTMTWAGARGDTASQIEKVLHTQGSLEDALEAEARVLAWVRDPAQTATLKVANRLFGDKSYTFDPTFLSRANVAFGAPLQPVDFAGTPDASRLSINDWIASQTDQRIKDLLPPPAVTRDTRLVLANAIYFLALWEHPFAAGETKPAPFHVSPESAKDVPTMHELERLSFTHADGVKVLEIPYAGRQLAMTFVLPDATDGLDAIESRLSPATLAAWAAGLTATRVRVALPRFEVDPAEPLALSGVLSSLGMTLAFERGKADFTGIGTSPRPEDRLYISDVFHKAFVKVDESGTEAAAATGISMRRPTFVLREAPPEEFTADHPFLFFLQEVGSGTILFMGRVGDPTTGSSR